MERMPEAPQIFISHSRHDGEFARFLCARLEESGLTPWIDADNIPAGSTWPREIEKAVEACAAMVVVMSEAARASEWVERETLRALDLGKPVFIALIDDTRMPLHLLNRQYTDFRSQPETALARLISALRRVVEPPPPASPLAPDPRQHAFFNYLLQWHHGYELTQIAQRLYGWAIAQSNVVTFRGRENPAFHAELWLGPGGLTLFSVRTYGKGPAVEIPLRDYAKFPPFDDRSTRLELLAQLNAIMPLDEQFSIARVDGRPQLPLLTALARDANLENFITLMGEVVSQLRSAEHTWHEQVEEPAAWFQLRHNQVAFTSNFANDLGCMWQGFGGAVISSDNDPLDGIKVHIYGNGVDFYSSSGTNPLYGPGGWEIQVADSINNGTYFVEIQSQKGAIISHTVAVTFPQACDGNLAVLNFEQVRLYEGST